MSVYRDKRSNVFRYDFWFRGERHLGNTYQQKLEDAKLVESKLKLQLRQEAGGIAAPRETPAIATWAGITYTHLKPKMKRPERLFEQLTVVLQFWGEAPKDPAKRVAKAKYHDLKLADPIRNPDWIVKFEDWMIARGVSPQTRNHYLSTMSALYRVALEPRFRKQSGVNTNPFVGIPRERYTPRDVTVTVDEARRWIGAASYHVRLAIAIAALAPKLRVRNILALKWKEHLTDELTFITVKDHKTQRHTKRPLVVPITGQLRAILEDAKQRSRSAYVVNYRGAPIESIRGGVKEAARRAGITYGLKKNGVTFHTLRHTMSTMLAELPIGESLRASVMGHESAETTKKYTHLRPLHELAPLEQLSARVPIADLVTQPWNRASNKAVDRDSSRDRLKNLPKHKQIRASPRQAKGERRAKAR